MQIVNRVKNILPYLFVVLFVTGPWFFKSGYLFFTDSVWGPRINLDWEDQRFLFNAAIKPLSFIVPLEFIQKLFISLILLIVLLGGKKIAEQFIGLENHGVESNKWLVFVVSLFALFNPFVYDRMGYGQISIVLAFGFLCLTIGYLLEVFRDSSKPGFAILRKNFILAGFCIGLAVQFSVHFVFFAGTFYLLFLALCFLKRKEVDLKVVLKNTLFIVLIVFVLNANWILGNVFGGGATFRQFVRSGFTRQDSIAFQISGATGGEALGNVLMLSGFWGKDQFRYADLTKFKENWGRSFWFLLPLILWGLLKGLKVPDKNQKHLTGGLTILFILSVILAVGIRLPVTRELTYWLFEHFPFYKGFRETQKWVSLIVVIYLIFLSLGIKDLFKKKLIRNNQFISKLFLGGLIIMQAPLLLFGLAGQVKPTNYPADWYEVDEFIKHAPYRNEVSGAGLKSYKVKSYKVESKKCEGKILFLPWHLYMSFNWIGRTVGNPSSKFFQCPVIYGKNMEFGGIFGHSADPDEREVEKWVFNFGRSNLLQENKLNITHIILAKEVDWRNYLWLGNHPNVEFIKETQNLRVYRTKRYETGN